MNKEVNPRCEKGMAEENHDWNEAGSQCSIGIDQVSVESVTNKMNRVENMAGNRGEELDGLVRDQQRKSSETP